jgi:diguanylate cyclase (GGDEF)-like protein
MVESTDKVQDIVRQATSLNAVNTVFFIALVVVTLFISNTVKIPLFVDSEPSWLIKSYFILTFILCLKLVMNWVLDVQKIITDSQFELTICVLNMATTFFLINALKENPASASILTFIYSFLPMLLFVLVSPLTWNKRDVVYTGFFGFMEWSLLLVVLFWGGNVLFMFFLTDDWVAILSNVVVLVSPLFIKLVKKRHLDKFFSNMHKEIYTDVLTGIQNRKCFYDYYDKVRGSNKADGKVALGFGVIFVDIDYFKQFNDSYGHENGDECLIVVAKELDELAKLLGIQCFRYGGEEFLLCAAMTEAQWELIRTCDRLSKWKSGKYLLDILHDKSPLGKVSMSAGASFYDDSVVYKTNAAGITKNADDYLYKAKNSGRARIVFNETVVKNL